MDTKRLREILEKFRRKTFKMKEGITIYDKDNIDQAIKEIQELCGKPMSEEEIAKSIYEHCNVHGYNMMRIEHRQFLAKALVGKLSTPRLTDWEKILPKKKDYLKAYSLATDKLPLSKEYVNGYNYAIADCLSALKSMSEPRLMERAS